MINKDKGQVSIEAIALLPLLIGLLTFIMSATYLVVAKKWTDHWVYRAALCRATHERPSQCKRALEQKLAVIIPTANYRWNSSWITRKASHIEVILTFGSIKIPSAATVPLPLQL